MEDAPPASGDRQRLERVRPPLPPPDRVLTGNPVLVALADHVAALMDQPLWQRLRDDSIATPGRTPSTSPSTA